MKVILREDVEKLGKAGEVVKVAPTVTSAKFGAHQTYKECLDASEGRINFLSIEMAALRFKEIAPDSYTACWSTASSMGPQPARALMAALKAGDYEKAAAIDADIQWACETFIPSDPTAFNYLNIQLEKLRMAGAGYCNPGPIRPPYNFVSAEYEANARECGRRWVEIAEKYA